MTEVLVFTAPWDTSLNMSKAASAQEPTEGDFAAEQMWRPGENLHKHVDFTRLKTNTTKSRESNHYACAQEKVEALPISEEPQHKKRRLY